MLCTICNHPERQAIDLALLDRTATLTQLSQQYQLSKSALHRHKQHLLKKMSQAQNLFHDLLRESYLFMLNKFLGLVWGIAQEADAAGNSRQQLQAVRQGTAIMKFMAKLDGSLSDETVHRLLVTPQWAAAGSLLPTDPRFLADCHQALADSLFSPCPEEPSSPAPEDLDLMQQYLQALNPDATPQPAAGNRKPETANCLVKREKNGKKVGKTSSVKDKYEENQSTTKNAKNIATSPGSFLETRNPKLETPNWVQDLEAGRLDVSMLNAIGAGRPLPELLDVFQAEIAAAGR
jgi:hypothetical protein